MSAHVCRGRSSATHAEYVGRRYAASGPMRITDQSARFRAACCTSLPFSGGGKNLAKRGSAVLSNSKGRGLALLDVDDDGAAPRCAVRRRHQRRDGRHDQEADELAEHLLCFV